jgi:hypothetical protein
MFGIPDLSGGGEGVATNYGIVGGPVPSDAVNPDGTPNPYFTHADTIAQANAATATIDKKIVSALTLGWVPWWVWGGVAVFGVLVLLHELNPTIELVRDVIK